MKAQTKALVASVVVIALALSAVSGITYSWFSDTDESSITVTTAKVDYDVAFTASAVKGLATVDSSNSPTFAVSDLAAAANITINADITNKSSIKTVYKVVLTPTYALTEGSIGFTMYDLKNILVQTYADTTTDLVTEKGETWTVGTDGVLTEATFKDILIKNWTVVESGTSPGKVQVVITTPVSYGSDSYDSSDPPAKIQSIKSVDGTPSTSDATVAGDGYVAWSATTERSGLSFTVKVIAVQGDYPYTAMTKETISDTNVSAAVVPSNKIVKAESIETSDENNKTASDVTIDFSNVATYSGTVSDTSETGVDVIGTKVTAKVTEVSTADSTVKVDLNLYKVVNESSTLITSPQFDEPVVITMTVPGAMTSPKITYNDEEDGEILSSSVNGSGYDATTTVVFSVKHFSEYVIKDGSIINNLDELTAAMAAGGSYKLGSSISDVSSNIEVTSDSTLDLNGHSIAFTGSVGFVYTAGFSVIGTTENSGITATDGKVFYSDTTGSSLTVNGGKYTADEMVLYSGGPKIDRWTTGVGGTVTILGGTFAMTADDQNSALVHVVNGKLTIKGGEFSSVYQSTIKTGGSDVQIDGGTFGSSKYIISTDESTLVINGGTFTGKAPKSLAGNYLILLSVGYSDTTINGGTFTVTANQYGDAAFFGGSYCDITVNEGSFTLNADEGINYKATFTKFADDEYISLMGGTYNADPSKFVPEGYEATNSEGTYTVQATSD